MKKRLHILNFTLFVLLFHFSLPIANAAECGRSSDPTFTVDLPVADEYAGDDSMEPDSIEIPNGRPIYALMVHGYYQNKDFDQLLTYNFSKRLMEEGAYVHYAWWNNLCAEYMARPLHQDNSHPGNFDPVGLLDPDLGDKAMPEDDYQFQADAERFLLAIREHNPNAIIILVGHSMGGAAVARLATNTDVVIDILAPIDPVDNRSKPEGRIPLLPYVVYWYPRPPTVFPDYNYTRWRIAHNEFRGYKQYECARPNGIFCDECIGRGDEWYGFYDLPIPHSTHLDCGLAWYSFPDYGPWYYPYADSPPRRLFDNNVINLLHRYQKEYFFPFDYEGDEHFIHNTPMNGTSSQASVNTCSEPWETNDLGWMCLPHDGHGEIVGFYGIDPKPIGLRAQDWPQGHFGTAPGENPREDLLEEMAEPLILWPHRPEHPELCMVSSDLIALYERMNLPPVADAGEDQLVECTGFGSAEVILDGSASFDPDTTDVLSYSWQGPFGEIPGKTITVTLGLGIHEITLTVDDPSGHVDCDILEIAVVDTQPPDLTVLLSHSLLWPPNHKMIDIEALVEAEDLCGDVVTLELVSIVSNEQDDGRGDGHTTGDIKGADIGTLDQLFQLRAERAGDGGGRVYTVTYRAVDASGNETIASAEVIVQN
jgi:pimeloyl-ACP methyl ester carboxylesterase